MTVGVLSQPTLVLNRSWSAIATTTARHAIGLAFTGAARIIRPETYETHGFDSWADLAVPPGEPSIRTVSIEIRIPEVIVLTRYTGMPVQRATFSRRNLYKRDGNTCQYCGVRPGTSELSIDHVRPRSRGGRSTWENCVLACVRCNSKKANRQPTEASMHLLRAPIAPRWTPIMEVPIARVRQSWRRFVSDRYWDVPLEP
jgi:5-methylcytosine-specific restriction endonuclease McrA